jgi:chromosome segregation ATPase
MSAPNHPPRARPSASHEDSNPYLDVDSKQLSDNSTLSNKDDRIEKLEVLAVMHTDEICANQALLKFVEKENNALHCENECLKHAAQQKDDELGRLRRVNKLYQLQFAESEREKDELRQENFLLEQRIAELLAKMQAAQAILQP